MFSDGVSHSIPSGPSGAKGFLLRILLRESGGVHGGSEDVPGRAFKPDSVVFPVELFNETLKLGKDAALDPDCDRGTARVFGCACSSLSEVAGLGQGQAW